MVADVASRRPNRVALIDLNPSTARMLRRVLQTTAVPIDSRTSIPDAVELADRPLIVANYDSLGTESVQRLLENAKASSADPCVILLSGNGIRTSLPTFLGDHKVRNLIGQDPRVDPAEFLVTVQKILGGDIFGLDKYFPWGARRETRSVTSSLQSYQALEWVKSFGDSSGVGSRLVERFISVCDELLSNALYNAPVDESGVRKFRHLERRQPVELAEDHAIDIVLCSDGRRLGVSVTDPYGSLRPDDVVEYLSRCMRRETNQMDEENGGAGLGLFQAFEATTHLAVNIEPGVRTDVIGLIDVVGSLRDFEARPKSLNIFVVGDSALANRDSCHDCDRSALAT